VSLRSVHSHIPNSLGEPSSAFFNPHSAFAYISSLEFRELLPHTLQQPPFSHSQLSSRLSRELASNSYPWLSHISVFKISYAPLAYQLYTNRISHVYSTFDDRFITIFRRSVIPYFPSADIRATRTSKNSGVDAPSRSDGIPEHTEPCPLGW
jgi:hypothetical protein